jgi:hypothetical protein
LQVFDIRETPERIVVAILYRAAVSSNMENRTTPR